MSHPYRRRQPARDYLIKERWSINKAADKIGVPRGHLHYVMFGTATPNSVVRERLPELLGVPLEDLFDADLLAREWIGHRGVNAKKRGAR